MLRTRKPIDLTDTQIAERAYARWIGRGRPISDGADDWFAARSEIEAELAAAKRSTPRSNSTAKSMRPGRSARA